jgi:hypothetical protein
MYSIHYTIMDKDNKEIKQDGIDKLAREYKPNLDYNKLFKERFENVDTRASRISQFKKLVVECHPEILSLSLPQTHNKEQLLKLFDEVYPEVKAIEALPPFGQYKL